MDLISLDECSKVIRNSISLNDYKILSYNVENATNSIGFLGEYYRLLIEIEDENSVTRKLSYFVKTLPRNNLKERQRLIKLGVFAKETSIYENLLQKFPSETKWHADCYYTRSDLLVLEDLNVLKYHHFSVGKDLPIDHIRSVLKILAQLHAGSIAFEKNNSINIGDKYKDILFETTVGEEVDWFLAGLEAIKAIALQHPNYQSQQHQQFIMNDFMNRIRPVYEMVNPSKKYRNVLCHRDAWGQNIFFHNDDNGNVQFSILVDFQTCRYCPPAIDFLFLIYLTTNRETCHELFDDCIRWYHTQLMESLNRLGIRETNDCISLKEFEESCKELRFFGILYNCLAATVLKLPEGFLINLKNNDPDSYHKYKAVSRIDVIEKLLKENVNFRKIMFDIVDDVIKEILN